MLRMNHASSHAHDRRTVFNSARQPGDVYYSTHDRRRHRYTVSVTVRHTEIQSTSPVRFIGEFGYYFAMADEVSAVLDRLRPTLGAAGFDLAAPMLAGWYNEEPHIAPLPDAHKLPAPPSALSILVGNSRALWAPFMDWVGERLDRGAIKCWGTIARETKPG